MKEVPMMRTNLHWRNGRIGKHPRQNGAKRFSMALAIGLASIILPLSTFAVPAHAATSCTGVTISPGASIQNAVNSKPSGTTFCLQTGTYRLSSGVLAKSYDRFIGQPGTVLDGQGVASQGLWGNGGTTGQRSVTVQGILFKGFTFEAVHAGYNWTITNNELSYSEIGVRVGTGTVLQDNYIHDNTQFGIAGGPANDILIKDNEIAHNNTSNSCGGTCKGSAGGTKIVGSTAGTYRVTWTGNWVHDNLGAGIAQDGNTHNTTIDNNLVENNRGPGIHYELSWDAVISNNTVRNNNSLNLNKSCYYRAQIDINTSQGLDIYGNTVSTGTGQNGICLASQNRGLSSPYPTSLANVTVHNNTITMTGSSTTGLKGGTGNNITFDYDTYYVPNLAGSYWTWYDQSPLTWSGLRARGQEVHGTMQAS
jgi:parallel beta-helix repeat protein